MTRFVVDAGAALQIVADEIEIASSHQLLAPTLIRSQVLTTLHEAVVTGELDDAVGRRRHAAFGKLRMRLLGDAVLQRRAWELADRLGWPSTFDAEYLALTQLQADAFVTTDAALAQRAREVVTTATLDDLRA
jgi:predicted nucleic acid-binding protein